jgi:N-acetylglutamate synthase-like GNAT family acetyltransferase
MGGTSLRRATNSDLANLRQLITDAYTKYIDRIGRPPAPMTADYAAAFEHSRVWVLVSDDAMVGALVTEDRGDHLLLETVAVAPAAQGHGYGRLLLDRAERDAAELGHTEVRLYTKVFRLCTDARIHRRGRPNGLRPLHAGSASSTGRLQ